MEEALEYENCDGEIYTSQFYKSLLNSTKSDFNKYVEPFSIPGIGDDNPHPVERGIEVFPSVSEVTPGEKNLLIPNIQVLEQKIATLVKNQKILIDKHRDSGLPFHNFPEKVEINKPLHNKPIMKIETSQAIDKILKPGELDCSEHDGLAVKPLINLSCLKKATYVNKSIEVIDNICDKQSVNKDILIPNIDTIDKIHTTLPNTNEIKVNEDNNIISFKSIKYKNLLYVGSSIAHNVDFNKLERKTGANIFRSKAYCSTYNDNPAVRFKDTNFKDIVNLRNKQLKPNILLMQASSVDIKILDDMKCITEQRRNFLAELSSYNMVRIALDSFKQNINLEQVIIFERTPRLDGLQNLTDMSNGKLYYFKNLYDYNNKIFIGKHNLNMEDRKALFGIGTKRYDGWHLRGGKEAYTNSILNILEQCGIILI